MVVVSPGFAALVHQVFLMLFVFFCPGAAVLFGGCSAYCHHRFWQVVGLRADSSVYDPDLVCLASPLVSGLVESSPAPRLLKPSLFAFIGVGARSLVRLVFLCFC